MTAPVRHSTGDFSIKETATLIALVYQAFELRESPYQRDAVDAILCWHERLALTRFEGGKDRQARSARLTRQRQDSHVELLRETNPRRLFLSPPGFCGHSHTHGCPNQNGRAQRRAQRRAQFAQRRAHSSDTAARRA